MIIIMSDTVGLIFKEKGEAYLNSLGKPTPRETKKGYVYFIVEKNEKTSNSTEDNEHDGHSGG